MVSLFKLTALHFFRFGDCFFFKLNSIWKKIKRLGKYFYDEKNVLFAF